MFVDIKATLWSINANTDRFFDWSIAASGPNEDLSHKPRRETKATNVRMLQNGGFWKGIKFSQLPSGALLQSFFISLI